MLRRAAIILMAVILAACRPDTLALTYSLEEGAVLTYRLAAHAEATWDIAGPGEGSYDVEFDVSETVLSSDTQGSVVRVAMTPTATVEEGLPSPDPSTRTFTLRIGPQGDVLEVVEVEGVEAESLEADDLTFIGTYRPPLPTERVRLGDGWQRQQRFEVAQIFQQIETVGVLGALRLGENGARLARLRYEGSGPVVWTTELAQGTAELSGSARVVTTATLDIDGGYLERARSSTEGTFDVQVISEEGRPPISGSLVLRVALRMERVDRIDTPIPPVETPAL